MNEPKQQINSQTGEMFNPQVAESQLEVLNTEENRILSLFRKCQKKIHIFYVLQKWFLILGLVGVAGAKIFAVVTALPSPS